MHKFVQNIVAIALRNHVLVLFMSGLLAVAGVILMVGVIKTNLRITHNLKQSITSAVEDRARSVLMIALLGSMGLLPAALSTGMGSEIQKPIAIMIVGGMIISMILSFSVLPQVFYFAYKNKYLREKKSQREK